MHCIFQTNVIRLIFRSIFLRISNIIFLVIQYLTIKFGTLIFSHIISNNNQKIVVLAVIVQSNNKLFRINLCVRKSINVLLKCECRKTSFPVLHYRVQKAENRLRRFNVFHSTLYIFYLITIQFFNQLYY